MNGSMPLPGTFGRHYRVFGGPYRQRPLVTCGVKMAEEIDAVSHVSIPTKDFSVPSIELATVGLERSVDLILKGLPVYVGCMGGIGRTGFFLALIAKAWGIEDPIAYVRKHYIAHAVETEQQKKYVRDFPISPELRRRIMIGRLLNLKFKSGLTLNEETLLALVPEKVR